MIHFIDSSFYDESYDITMFHRFPRLRLYTLLPQFGDIILHSGAGHKMPMMRVLASKSDNLALACYQELNSMRIYLRTVMYGYLLLPIVKHCGDIETLELAFEIPKLKLYFYDGPAFHPVLTLVPRYFHKISPSRTVRGDGACMENLEK